MSDNIPIEIQMDIIQRITDSKSLIRCRSVSKAWKSLIDSKEFVTAHTLRCTTHHLLIRTEDTKACKDCEACEDFKYIEDYDDCEDPEDTEDYKECEYCCDIQVKFVSIVDDDTFPHQKLSVFVPDLVNKVRLELLGASHGLFCFYDKYETGTAVIWNPTIRKTVAIPVPNVSREWYCTTLVGFGVCPRNLDPKLVKITYVTDCNRLRDVNSSTQVEVFTISSGGTWRSPLSSNLPHKLIQFRYSQAVVDGFIYWDAVDMIDVGYAFRVHNVIMSFDLTTEEFTKVNLPDHLAHKNHADLSLSNLRGSLAVLEVEFHRYDQRIIYHVWMMIGHGCTRSFNKLYSIDKPNAIIHKTLGFRKSGGPIIEVKKESQDHCCLAFGALATYEPESKSHTNIGIYGLHSSFFVHSYIETLLLLGH